MEKKMINLKRALGGQSRRRQVITAMVVLVASLCAFYPPLMAAPKKISSVELAGVAGAANNVAFAFDRYVLVAPYAPSAPVTRTDDPTELDNHFLYLIDTKKANIAIPPKDLTAFSSGGGLPKTVYYPTRIKFDPNTGHVYVRGTRFEIVNGVLEEIEVLAYVHVNLDDNGKPYFDSSVVVIDIKGVGEDFCREAPTDFVLGHKGSLLVFTNGASVFTFNVNKGYVYQVDIVPANEYGDDSSIAQLDIDEDTNLLTIVWNRRITKDEGPGAITSELSFYQLKEDGVLPLIKRAYPEDFPANSYITEGSNVAIASSPSSEAGQFDSSSGFFVTNNGELCAIDMLSEGVRANVRTLHVFPELAQGDSREASPRTISYDAKSRMVAMAKNGLKANIRKLINGRPGRRGTVIRTFSADSIVEGSALALVRFNKKGKVVSTAVFSEIFDDGAGLSNLNLVQSGQWLVSSRTGRLFSIKGVSDLEKVTPEEIGAIGERIDRIAYLSSRSSIVAINSYASSEEGTNIESPGSIVVASLEMDAGEQTMSANIESAFSPLRFVAAAAPRIRRPCNVRR
jgi:hypothetical protein